jgi:Zinc carboxypeptidase
VFVLLIATQNVAAAQQQQQQQQQKPTAAPVERSPVEFIDTSFENASPLWYDVADGVVRIHLLYDHERASPNRAAGHVHFAIHARPGTKLTLEFLNLDNVYNGKPDSIAPAVRAMAISPDGRTWRTVPTERPANDRVQLRVEMPGPTLYVAHVEPYRLSDLDRLLESIQKNPRVRITPIGKTAAGRILDMIHISAANATGGAGAKPAPYRVFVRARAHPWEAGTNWVAQGLIERLLKDDDEARRFLQVYSVSILPMANKDGVARGGTRFNLRGKDLNRDWNAPADPELSPENASLERWLDAEIAAGRKPHFAIELHNDGNGRLHLSRPPVPDLDRHLARMKVFEDLLRAKTWFTEGTTPPGARTVGTMGDGWLERYGIDAAVHELNVNWIAGRKEYPSSRLWLEYGASLAEVFHDYFVRVKP